MADLNHSGTVGVDDPRVQRGWLLMLAVVLATPYAIAGPGWFREDFVSLFNASQEGAWGAAGPVVGENRPLTRAVYALVYGPLGDHPAIVHALLTLGIAAAAVLLREWLVPMLGRIVATGVATVYLLHPAQSSLWHWASALNIVLAVVLFLTNAVLVQRRRWALAGTAVGLGTLAYEAIVPAALVLWVFTGWRRRTPRGPMTAFAFTAPSVTWVLATTTNADPYTLRTSDGLGSLLGFGLTRADPLWRTVMLALMVAIVGMAWAALTGRVTERSPERLLALGIAAIVVGYAPYARFGFGMDFTGQGDRANVIAIAGAACVLTSIGWRLTRLAPSVSVAPVGCLVLFAALTVPTRIGNDRDWAEVWEITRAALSDAADQGRGDEPISIPACPTIINGVQGIDTDYSATFALRWWLDQPDVVADCAGEG